jgi:hypothetical protein
VPRFSLVLLACAITVVAMAFGLSGAWRENARLDARNKQLSADNARYRDELGILDFDEPDKIHAIRVETDSPDRVHRFRVYLPPGRQYETRFAVHNIPQQGMAESPIQSEAMEIGPGESLVTCTLRPQYDRKTGERLPFAVFEIHVDGLKRTGYTISVGERLNDWIIYDKQ